MRNQLTRHTCAKMCRSYVSHCRVGYLKTFIDVSLDFNMDITN